MPSTDKPDASRLTALNDKHDNHKEIKIFINSVHVIIFRPMRSINMIVNKLPGRLLIELIKLDM